MLMQDTSSLGSFVRNSSINYLVRIDSYFYFCVRNVRSLFLFPSAILCSNATELED